jgi:tetratricopeptide (TPR) repeat protein
MRHRRTLCAALVVLALAGGCSTLAVWSAPKKQASTARTAEALRADELFWRTLHGGAYEQIPQALIALKAAYLANPSDAVTAAHVGWMHIWRLAERVRLGSGAGPGITDDAMLARRYFEEAVRLDPREARYLGFYASALMTEGTIHRDEKLVRRGYFAMQDAVAAWPEFNYFTSGYSVSAQPHDSSRFREGLDAQWLNLDVCVGERIDRANPDYARYMRLETKDGPKRVCWNSWIAPHNFEGFFLNLGDMLVKAGEPDRAVIMYRNAMLTPDYAQWPYKGVLEQRIAQATRNVEVFRRKDPPRDGPAMMVRSTYACMGCHQQ